MSPSQAAAAIRALEAARESPDLSPLETLAASMVTALKAAGLGVRPTRISTDWNSAEIPVAFATGRPDAFVSVMPGRHGMAAIRFWLHGPRRWAPISGVAAELLALPSW